MAPALAHAAAQIGHLPLPEGLQLLFTSTGDHMCNTSRFVSPRLFGLWWFGIIAVTLKAVFSDIWGLPRVSTCLTLVSADW